jgi:DNA-binding NarL/FixJ family response regulator
MCTILVIDDEKGILSVIKETLTRFGHNVEIAIDGIEGIQKFDDGSYDMVITDLFPFSVFQELPGRLRIRVSMRSFPNHFRCRSWWSQSKNY